MASHGSAACRKKAKVLRPASIGGKLGIYRGGGSSPTCQLKEEMKLDTIIAGTVVGARKRGEGLKEDEGD